MKVFTEQNATKMEGNDDDDGKDVSFDKDRTKSKEEETG